MFHADSGLWDGRKTAIRTTVESAVYCDFDTIPDLALSSGNAEFSRKLKAISAYRSQRQIADLVGVVKAGGPIEIFRTMPSPNYSARAAFEKYFQSR